MNQITIRSIIDDTGDDAQALRAETASRKTGARKLLHGPQDFTGEMSMLAGRRALVRARVTKPSRLLRVELPQFRNLMQTDADLSEV